jgi:hypothetical protein
LSTIDYLKTANVWVVLDLIVAEFQSDPMSCACFDKRLVARAIELNKEHKEEVIEHNKENRQGTW